MCLPLLLSSLLLLLLLLCERAAAQANDTATTTTTAPTPRPVSTTAVPFESLTGCWQIEEGKFYANDKLDVVYTLAELWLRKQDSQYVGAVARARRGVLACWRGVLARQTDFGPFSRAALTTTLVSCCAGTVWNEFGETNFSATPSFGELEFEINGGCLPNCSTKTTVRLGARARATLLRDLC